MVPSYQHTMSGRGGRKMSKEPTGKFYEVQARPSADDVRERVVGRTRQAMASLETARPVTPADSSRGLFGTSRRGSGSSSAGSGRERPTSAFPMGRKQFLQDLPGSSEIDEGSRPASVVSLGGGERRGSSHHVTKLTPMTPMSPAPPAGGKPPRIPRNSSGDVGSPASSKRAMPRPPDRGEAAACGARAGGVVSATPPRPPTVAWRRDVINVIRSINRGLELDINTQPPNTALHTALHGLKQP